MVVRDDVGAPNGLVSGSVASMVIVGLSCMRAVWKM